MSQSNDPSRRDFIVAATVVAAAGAGACRRGAPAAPLLSSAELVEFSAVDAIAALKRGDLTAERYASALLARCEVGKSLNAFITLEPERVLEAARLADRRRVSGAALGALHGLPIPIKDSINTKDLRTHRGDAGPPRLPAEGRRPGRPLAGRGRRHRVGQDQPARAVIRVDQHQPGVRRGA